MGGKIQNSIPLAEGRGRLKEELRERIGETTEREKLIGKKRDF